MLITLVLFLFFSNKVIVELPQKLYESKATPESKIGHYKYAVVLGGYAAYDTRRETVNFHTSIDRLLSGFRLQDLGIVDTLLLSGGAGSLTHTELREAQFVHDAIPGIFEGRDYILENESRNTYENALKCHHILKSKGALDQEILLITSAVHMPRAKACFKKQGINVVPYPVDFIDSGVTRWYDIFLPRVSAFSDWNKFTHEWVGYLMYRIRGYV